MEDIVIRFSSFWMAISILFIILSIAVFKFLGRN